jgi:hypothetical protein
MEKKNPMEACPHGKDLPPLSPFTQGFINFSFPPNSTISFGRGRPQLSLKVAFTQKSGTKYNG